MSREVGFFEQVDGSIIKEVYDTETGKHDLYGPDGDTPDHDHTAFFDSATDDNEELGVTEVVADYVRSEDEVVFDSGFFGPSESRDDFFEKWT